MKWIALCIFMLMSCAGSYRDTNYSSTGAGISLQDYKEKVALPTFSMSLVKFLDRHIDFDSVEANVATKVFTQDTSIELGGGVPAFQVSEGTEMKITNTQDNEFTIEFNKPAVIDLAFGIFQSEVTHMEVTFDMGSNSVSIGDNDMRDREGAGGLIELFSGKTFTDINY